LYKFTKMSRKEFEAMFQLEDLKKTRIYQEAMEEGKQEGKQEGELKGKLDMVPWLVQSGLSVEQIAKNSGLDIEAVRLAARSGTNGSKGNEQVA
ncbi:MAG: hypothetical protein M3Y56_15080, partial [Armatimonadota bacterium]|nr:hypothetical protein [Armatimonadota bacterium]